MMKLHPELNSSERYLEIALECAIDIGEMIISREKLKRPESYPEVFIILGQQGVLPEKFSIKFAPYAGFRNRLVHMYAKIDIEKLHYYLQNNIGDIEQFGKYISQYLIKRR